MEFLVNDSAKATTPRLHDSTTMDSSHLDLHKNVGSINQIPSSQFSGYVIAIGASAGGLDALERFFDKLVSNSGASIIVIPAILIMASSA